MIEVIQSASFSKWLRTLRDRKAAARIIIRIRHLESGNPGDVKPIGRGLSEMRINYGPGYRVYYMQRGPVFVVLLCGGNKSTQDRDIARAFELAEDWKG